MVPQHIALNHYLHEMPATSASRLRNKALAINVLEKISWVAFFAIMAAIFTVSYAGLSLTGSLPLVLVSMALCSPLLGLAASQLNTWSFGYAKKAELEEGVNTDLKAIAHWKTREIEGFFREHNLR